MCKLFKTIKKKKKQFSKQCHSANQINQTLKIDQYYCKQRQSMSDIYRNPSKLWGLEWSESKQKDIKKNTIATTKSLTTTDPVGKHKYSKVRSCENTWACKQIWIKWNG